MFQRERSNPDERVADLLRKQVTTKERSPCTWLPWAPAELDVAAFSLGRFGVRAGLHGKAPCKRKVGLSLFAFEGIHARGRSMRDFYS